ncbi:uncharacterized protein LOC128344937 [Hemicordylus capensis]|uniref:uncharacterized protein LOC128344937 n=1 Tax=Hemicordylus capensis TaxID=884348 RepID=UPI0023033301|nr:uncharacterized protein LOC128344937 [Hemicordylus capensis]
MPNYWQWPLHTSQRNFSAQQKPWLKKNKINAFDSLKPNIIGAKPECSARILGRTESCLFWSMIARSDFKNMRKHLASIGAVQEFDRNTEFTLKAKVVVALAFVPVLNLGEHVATLEEYLPEELQPLLNWFKESYISHPGSRGHGRLSPLFPPPLWNLFDRTLNVDDHTNNHAEAAHHHLRAKLEMCHLTIGKFIDDLRKVQKGREAYYEPLVSGHSPPVKLKKYYNAD